MAGEAIPASLQALAKSWGTLSKSCNRLEVVPVRRGKGKGLKVAFVFWVAKGGVKMPSVKIYTTSTCPYCVMTKQFFKANNVKYDEVNVEGNPQAQKDLIEKSGQMGVPVIDVDGKIIVGYDQPALKKALKIA